MELIWTNITRTNLNYQNRLLNFPEKQLLTVQTNLQYKNNYIQTCDIDIYSCDSADGANSDLEIIEI